MQAIRTQWDFGRASLQTAVGEMRGRAGGRRIVLVAAVHVGSREYFGEIQRLIDAHEAAGGVVLYEGLGSLSEFEIAELPPSERAVYRTLAPLHELYGAFARSLSLAFQGDVIRYDRARWINADIPLRELLQRWSESGAPLLPLGEPGAAGFDIPNSPLARGISALTLLQTPLMLSVLNRLHGRIPALGKLRELLLSDRNRAALDAVDASPADRDALILYGAGHIEGLAEGLERRGYVAGGQSWLTAFTLDLPWASGVDGLRSQVTAAQKYWRAARGR
jgi:hypothetical protein